MMLYPVHRLDELTSGVLLLARSTETHRQLSMALSQPRPKKKQGWVKRDWFAQPLVHLTIQDLLQV
jgi:tRNA pseudouridine32 synthase / 23S rRNA pseudouridine746 synthase